MVTYTNALAAMKTRKNRWPNSMQSTPPAHSTAATASSAVADTCMLGKSWDLMESRISAGFDTLTLGKNWLMGFVNPGDDIPMRAWRECRPNRCVHKMHWRAMRRKKLTSSAGSSAAASEYTELRSHRTPQCNTTKMRICDVRAARAAVKRAATNNIITAASSTNAGK